MGSRMFGDLIGCKTTTVAVPWMFLTRVRSAFGLTTEGENQNDDNRTPNND